MDSTLHQNKVSVVIPAYNRSQFIPNAVKSIIKQEYDNIEIIIVDDGSTDNTDAVVNSLQKIFPNIFYYHNERSKGPSGARNTGILKSSGEYIAFLDSDDVWLNGHLKKGLDIFEKNPKIDVIFGNFSVHDLISGKHLFDFFDQKTILHALKCIELSPGIKILNDNLFLGLIQENFFHIGSSIIRDSSKGEVLFDESIMFAEDRDFAIKLYKEAKAIFAYYDEPLFILYKHDSHLYNTEDSNIKQLEAHLYLFSKYFKTYNLSKKEKRALIKLIFKKALDLSYAYGKNNEFRNAISCVLKGFRYSLSSFLA